MTTRKVERSLTEDVLARASEDWITAAEVIDLSRQSGLKDPEDLRDLAIGLTARLIANGLVVPGDLAGSDHRPWGCSAADAIARIVEDWSARSDPFVMPGEIVWLNTSPKGQRVGESILERESQ